MLQSQNVNWPFLFIPAALCLLLILFGGICAVAAALLLKQTKRTATTRPGDYSPPPVTGPEKDGARRPRWRTVVSLCLLAVSGVTGLAGLAGLWATRFSIGWAQNSPSEWSDGRAPELEPLIRKHCIPFLNAGKSVGMAVAVVTPTNTTIMTFGRPALSSGASVRPDTFFEIGSITKTFTGMALARAIERGVMRLDQPVQELLPARVELPEAARAITLRHLTSHSSGFPRLPADSSLLDSFAMVLFGSDPYAGYTEAALLEDVRKVELDFRPGTKASYSNFGMFLLGHLLATKAGCSYGELVKRDVCGPLGMNDTTVTIPPDQTCRVAQGYRAALRCGPLLLCLRSVPWFEENDLGGAGALRSTGADLLKYLQANMRPEGHPLEHAIRESHRELFREDDRTAYGMNWVRTEGQTLKQLVLWHNGGTGGFSSFLGFAERSRVGVLMLSNSSESVDDLATELLRDLAAAAGQVGIAP